jgi:GSH-dependent disulfide-bond oxidoreductase
MIDLYSWRTPNGRKVSIMLEEVGLPYELHPINIGKGEQFQPDFLKISPNNKIPAIVDSDGPDGKPYSLFESGAILLYLSEKSGGKLMPEDTRNRYDTMQWLMFQMGGVGPMFGQAHHFIRAKEQVPYGIERYKTEARRLYGVMQKQLSEREYLAGAYTVADIATYPWVARYEWHQVDLTDFPNVKRWFDTVGARPAVKKGMSVPPDA